MATELSEIFLNVNYLKDIVSRAICRQTKEHRDSESYFFWRMRFIKENLKLPEFVKNWESLQALEDFFERKFKNEGDGTFDIDLRMSFINDEFKELLNQLNPSGSPGDLFKYQFPYGLPFGIKMPNVVVVPDNSSQKICFDETLVNGVIKGNVYPDFTYKKLLECLDGQSFSPSIENLQISCTPNELCFLNAYEEKYKMTSEGVPVLVPQAWIEWHSKTKANLRNEGSAYKDNLMRVDFVAFWKNKRFAILVDDIGHYSIKNSMGTYVANEEQYSKRLKEDRKLRKESWEVFRVSNWEVREDHTGEVLNDLKDHIGF